jgi:hypothetical protein
MQQQISPHLSSIPQLGQMWWTRLCGAARLKKGSATQSEMSSKKKIFLAGIEIS